MPEYSIEQWPISRCIPYARNPRKNDQVVDQMAASIREFGFKIPILAKSDGTIVDGHLRLKAAQALGIETVPVILCDEWSEVQVKAFRILVNRSATWAEWDEELLALEFEDLQNAEFDLQFTGFTSGEIDKVLTGIVAPEAFGEYDESIPVEHVCPKCGYRWSGGEKS
jgi:ParB-like chromosome segregation protein Spo0J